jgi:hypothetical protein
MAHLMKIHLNENMSLNELAILNLHSLVQKDLIETAELICQNESILIKHLKMVII